MKTIKLLVHPFVLIISFLLILISGEHLGGFYLLYLLLALPIGASHSLLALIGIISILFSYHKYKEKQNFLFQNVINIIGLLFLLLSIYVFFANDKERYNYGTFSQTVPLITLIIFVLISVCFLIQNLRRIAKRMNIIKSVSSLNI
jgi:hypothetical protein